MLKLLKFKNEPFVDFTKTGNRRKMEKAIAKVEHELGREYHLVIGGEKITTPEKFYSYNPAKPSQMVGVLQKADASLAKRAIETAHEKFLEWQYVPAEKRAAYLLKASKILRAKKFEYAAWQVFEVGKNWAEADADVAEAIDYLEYYSREMLRYAKGAPITKIPSEKSEMTYIPLGVGVVVPPWNFPLAIMLGMSTASIVAGNTVVLKPSSDSPVIGAKFVELMAEAGLPDGVLNFVSGSGAEVGDTLVAHPKTRFVAFTGSKEVGTHINKFAAEVQPGQIWVKRVVVEMGGKDAIVVDSEANVNLAVEGVVASAFGFQGQKCSACSRAIVDEKVYDKFVAKLKAAVEKIKIKPPKENGRMGPVINAGAEKKILEYAEIGKKEGRLLTGGTKASDEGYYVKPTVVVDLAAHSRVAQEEIFGPVLAVIKARNFDHALEIANSTEYGLTGSIYSKNRKKLEKGKKLFNVGNLYLNRKCTGALVGVHPFGGFNMSGTDSKAGGPDYLLLFMQAKVVSEKK
ncbi:MAG: L-glutamate gamma-semialdehyde dehydrogenase [Bacteroidetes bacterium]|nr:L-glutamate gamma-semialdehyde dehydrogenase [Bacteroidota bacterium]MCL5737589.1 L-glutamate gamma-semialdehyde dehydrogenase [Bacteroidota bacterium]